MSDPTIAERQPGHSPTRSLPPTGPCPACGAPLTGPGAAECGVCGACGHHLPLTASQRIALLIDDGSFREIDRYLVSVDPLEFVDQAPYPARLAQARRETGLFEAVVTGEARIHGYACLLVVSDFRFLGGSMGPVVGEKVTRAMERAVERRLPLIVVTASGGARMQEGMLSLMQMAKTAAAAMRLHQAGVPCIGVLTHPTMGGVLASYASQVDVALAEPGALIGFAGPRVVRETTGQHLPADFQRAEFLRDHGLVDAVVDRRRLREALGTLLHLSYPSTLDPARPAGAPSAPAEGSVPPSAWETVALARHPDRPTARDYLSRLFPQFFELHGDRAGADDPALIGGLGRFEGANVVVIAQERGHEDPAYRGGRVGPAGYRKAVRLMHLAATLRLPLVTLIDTPGAELSVEAEAGGLAYWISACLGQLTTLPVPTVALVIGEGGSGGALALGVADRVLLLEHAVYSVIAPEGAAAILYHTGERAPEVAEALKLTAPDCFDLGIVDGLVPEPPGGAHRDPDGAAVLVGQALLSALTELANLPPRKLLALRYQKFRELGPYESRFRERLDEYLLRLRSRLYDRLSETLHSLRGLIFS